MHVQKKPYIHHCCSLSNACVSQHSHAEKGAVDHDWCECCDNRMQILNLHMELMEVWSFGVWLKALVKAYQ